MSDKKTPTNNHPKANEAPSEAERPKCGIIMPISTLDGLLPSHWEDVKGILREAIEAAGFEAELVSETEESTIIHKTIIQNLYNNPIVVCDVSGKNPNVMFELGVRLTFDKPTVVVKDDKTDYSFDMSPIEHVGYPRDLRFHQIVQFKEKLAAKVKATYELATKDRNYSTFLKHFGQFILPKLEQKEVSPDEFIIKRLEELTQSMSRLERATRFTDNRPFVSDDPLRYLGFDVGHQSAGRVKKILKLLQREFPTLHVELTPDELRVFTSPLTSHGIESLKRRILSEFELLNEAKAHESETAILSSGEGN
jgi:hypothetical protein